MRSNLLKFIFLFLSASCICGLCSKNDAGNNNTNNSNTKDTVLDPIANWVYFDACTSLINFYPGNDRSTSKKWVATSPEGASVFFESLANRYNCVWQFENTGNTRFLSNSLNPGGEERMYLFLLNFSGTPGPGTYTMDIDHIHGFLYYYVFNSSGALHDSTRQNDLGSSSTLNISKMVFDHSYSQIDWYKMSGTATFHIMYWQNGTSSTSDIHTIQCTFNNIDITFSK